MLLDAHRQAAEDNEATLAALQSNPRAARVVIETCWGAAFHWIAFGCQGKHGQHQDSHARLGRILRSLSEPAVALWWEELDQLRQGGWYGSRTDPATVQRATELLAEIHAWAVT